MSGLNIGGESVVFLLQLHILNTMDTQKMNELKDTKGVALVEFYASWCPHCKRMMPVVEDIKVLLDGRAKVYQFDIDENSDFATALDVTSIPAFIIVRDGEEMWRATGEMDGSVLESKVESFL